MVIQSLEVVVAERLKTSGVLGGTRVNTDPIYKIS